MPHFYPSMSDRGDRQHQRQQGSVVRGKMATKKKAGGSGDEECVRTVQRVKAI
jgi:hypothetical protein